MGFQKSCHMRSGKFVLPLISLSIFSMIVVMFQENTVFKAATRAVVPQTCNFTAFQRELQLDAWYPVVPVHLISECRHVFYNRHPKTASRTVKKVFFHLEKQRNFTVIKGRTEDRDWYFFKRYVDENMLRMQQADYRFVFVAHMLYHDFRSVPNYADNSIYINVIREPAPWFISWYNWNRYGPGRRRPHFNETRQMSINKCIENVTCSQHHKASAIHYLCGEESVCRTRSGAALNRATQRLNEDYLSVGLKERLEDTLEIWEYLMPQMFAEARNVFNEIGRKWKKKTALTYESTVNTKYYKSLKSNLNLDYEMYNIVSERFDKMLGVIRLLQGIHVEGHRTAWNRHYMRVIKTWLKKMLQLLF